MAKPKVVISNRVHSEVLAFLEPHCHVLSNASTSPWSYHELRKRTADAHALVAFMPDRVDDAFVEGCPNLGVVACALKGFDSFDIEACSQRGVWVTAVPDLLTAPTAELAVGLLIALARNIPAGDRLVRGGEFQGWRPTLYGKGLTGSVVGIIGAGRIGSEIAKRVGAFGCNKILCHDPQPLEPGLSERLGLTPVPMDELLVASDFLICAAPLNAESLHQIDAEALSRIKRGCVLINVGRGSVVDERAVAEALERGELGGYAADVFELEDWSRAERPRSIPRGLLAEHERTLFTPHLGSAVATVRLEIELAAARSVLQYLQGEVPGGALNRPKVPRSVPSSGPIP